MYDAEVLIVGAGPTGLVAACELARRGVDCRIIDKSPHFFEGSRGKGVMPRTQEVFEDLGVIEEINTHAELNPPMRLYNRQQLTGVLHFDEAAAPSQGTPYPGVIMLPQWRTEAILRARLESLGVQVEFGLELSGFTQDECGVEAQILCSGTRESLELRAKFVVGADGGRSVIRRILAVPFVGESSDEQHFLIGDVGIEGLDREYRYAFYNPDGNRFVQACPLKGTHAWQFGGNVLTTEYEEQPEPTLDLLQEMFDRCSGLPGVRLRDPKWTSSFSYNARRIEQYRVGRVLLAGDAAHVHSPVTGEGLNAGVQDAYNLGWKLALVVNEHAPATLLDSYQEERLPVANAVLTSSSSGHSALFSTNPIVSFLRKRVVFPLLRRRHVGGLVMRRVSGLGVNYRDSSLSKDVVGRGRVRAGDRAPDGLCRTRGGLDVRLFDCYRGSHFTILTLGAPSRSICYDLAWQYGDQVVRVFSVTRTTPAGGSSRAGTLIDPTGKLLRTYGVRKPMVMIIRPDGYVAYRADATTADVATYLRSVVKCPANRLQVERVPDASGLLSIDSDALSPRVEN